MTTVLVMPEDDFDEEELTAEYDYWYGPGLWQYLKRHYRKVPAVTADDLPVGDVITGRPFRRRKQRANATYSVLNGRRITPTDVRWLAKLRRGKIPQVTLAKIDHLCTYYDLPLWEALRAADPRQFDKAFDQPNQNGRAA